MRGVAGRFGAWPKAERGQACASCRSRPSTPSSPYRACQRQTAGRLTPTRRATSSTGRRSAEERADPMKRRVFLFQSAMVMAWLPHLVEDVHAQSGSAQMTLLSAPLELGGEWGGSPPNDAFAVISRMREVCLSGIRLLSDRQPAKLRVDDHMSGLPHIWLHDENSDMAWIVVDISALDWCKLSYQFGHELGHVLCNSWQRRGDVEIA